MLMGCYFVVWKRSGLKMNADKNKVMVLRGEEFHSVKPVQEIQLYKVYVKYDENR